jgi:hypothetical protein
MPREHHEPEEIVAKLRQVDVLNIARQVGGRFDPSPASLR